MHILKIPNSNSPITKAKSRCLDHLVIGNWNLFGIWDLELGIYFEVRGPIVNSSLNAPLRSMTLALVCSPSTSTIMK